MLIRKYAKILWEKFSFAERLLVVVVVVVVCNYKEERLLVCERG